VTSPLPAQADDVESGAAAEKHLAEGWQYIRYGNYPAAETSLDAVLETAASDELTAEALYAMGYLWRFRRPDPALDKARAFYRRVADDYPHTRAGPWAMLALARMADLPPVEEQRLREQARQLYRKVLDAAPNHPAAEEATLRLAMTYLEEVSKPEAQDRGARILRDHLRRSPRSPLAAAMHVVLGDLHRERKEYREAINRWIAGVRASYESRAAGAKGKSLLNSTQRAELYFAIAYAAEKAVGDLPLGARWYERLVVEVPRHNRYFVAKLSAEAIHQRLARQAFEAEQYARAVEHWQAVERVDRMHADGDAGGARALSEDERGELYWNVATTAEEHLRDYDLAVRWYQRIPRSSKRHADAQSAIARCRRRAGGERGTRPAPGEGRP
jgi:tetratricopeptide (TPR) repeat protein